MREGRIENYMIDEVYREPTEEVLTPQRLEEFISNGIRLKHYIGFEISGFVHLGNGILCMKKVADFQKAGIETNIFLADYHSWINKKLGGDLSTIRKVAVGYFKEALKVTLEIVGGNSNKVNFILGSELYEKLGRDYLEMVLKVSINTTLSRMKRSLTILGRKEGENVNFAQLIYPAMQVADIFALGVNLSHGGMDQRKAHVIAIEIGEKIAGYAPVAVHHHLLLGLHIDELIREKLIKAKKEGNRELFEESVIDIKMSKSKPETALFIHDTEEEIKRKIEKAFCPPREIELNPIIEIVRYIIFGTKRNFEVHNLKTGEVKIYESYETLEKDYILGKIHPADLKHSVIIELLNFLQPVRKYFLDGPGKKYLEEMRELKISR